MINNFFILDVRTMTKFKNAFKVALKYRSESQHIPECNFYFHHNLQLNHYCYYHHIQVTLEQCKSTENSQINSNTQNINTTSVQIFQGT